MSTSLKCLIRKKQRAHNRARSYSHHSDWYACVATIIAIIHDHVKEFLSNVAITYKIPLLLLESNSYHATSQGHPQCDGLVQMLPKLMVANVIGTKHYAHSYLLSNNATFFQEKHLFC